MTEQEWWEDFKRDFKRDVMEARAIIECMQLYELPANCDPVKMAKDVEAFRKAWERMAETLEAIEARQNRKAELKSIASLARATALGIGEAI